MDQTRRDYSKKILDRIASDPTFREELLDDPKGAIERAGLKWEGPASDEVSGYTMFGDMLPTPLPPVPNPGGESNLLMGFQCNTVGTGKGIVDPGDPRDPEPKGK